VSIILLLEDLSRLRVTRRVILSIIGVIAVAMVVTGVIIAANNREPSPDAQLCDLLRDGYTMDQLATDDTWREWPETQSHVSRTTELFEAATRGNCFDRT
jgi:hypothetical protein